jgi:hypothetical protein
VGAGPAEEVEEDGGGVEGALAEEGSPPMAASSSSRPSSKCPKKVSGPVVKSSWRAACELMTCVTTGLTRRYCHDAAVMALTPWKEWNHEKGMA